MGRRYSKRVRGVQSLCRFHLVSFSPSGTRWCIVPSNCAGYGANEAFSMNQDDFFDYLKTSGERVLAYMRQSNVTGYFGPPILRQIVWTYLERRAKRLRPAVLLMAAGCMGGEERVAQAIPAAAGVELFHTWTLVHDDLIDNDALRRGKPSAHIEAADIARRTLGMSEDVAAEFGRDVAILGADVQHGWSTTAFVDSALQAGADAEVVLAIVRCAESYVVGNLICGETLDVEYGMTHAVETRDITEEEIEYMLWLKTGILCEFAGWAGALIGSGHAMPIEQNDAASPTEEAILAIRLFTGSCGIAFQLQDDILGIVGEESSLGKPIGSDIREGKQTIIVHEALKNASAPQKETLLSILGNKGASADDVARATNLLRDMDGVQRAEERAGHHNARALAQLPRIPDGHYKELLKFWADFMVNREF